MIEGGYSDRSKLDSLIGLFSDNGTGDDNGSHQREDRKE